MSLLQKVIKKRSEDQQKSQDVERLVDFSQRVKKLRGESPIATSAEPEVALEVVSINIRDIEVPPNYTRKAIGDVSQLARSIQIYGMQQPIKVVKIRGTKKYRLVFGRRRIKAAQELGMEAVPCIVELVAQKDRLMMLSLCENMHRHDLSAMEEAASYKYLTTQAEVHQGELHENLGCSSEYIQATMEFLDLPEVIRKEVFDHGEKYSWEILQKLIEAFRLSMNHGKRLFQAVYSGQIKTASEAEMFLRNLA